MKERSVSFEQHFAKVRVQEITGYSVRDASCCYSSPVGSQGSVTTAGIASSPLCAGGRGTKQSYPSWVSPNK